MVFSMASNEGYFIGIDVGTQSVRGGLIQPDGSVSAVASLPIRTQNPFPDMFEQSSDEIWSLCMQVVKDITKDVDPNLVHGIGFDATCSLVVLDKEFKSVTVSKTGNPKQNIILWMDHRAVAEADFINSKPHRVLDFVGGKISPEMEPPKLLWLKKNLPDQWEKFEHFFDLPDFLTWRATGSLQRSLCSLVCKWTYQAGQETANGWQDDFWKNIGLEDLVFNNYKNIGTEVLTPGEKCGNGLCEAAAEEMGLKPGTPVSASIIDAHAGGLGVLACKGHFRNYGNIDERMAVICGTSTCHMKVSKQPIFTQGIWGPYFSAMVPDYWCSEAGQSAAGALLDHVINSHPASVSLKEHIRNHEEDRHITDMLNESAIKLSKIKGLPSVSLLTSDYHVYPDYHGNRSPLANPSLKGMICGLTLSSKVDDLVKQYIATVQALAYSTKHIITSLENTGHSIKCLLVCGGLAKNPFYVQMHADITGLPVIIPHNSEPVLVGSAILAASAANYYPSVVTAMSSMCGDGVVIEPSLYHKEYHEKKYQVFLKLLKCQEKVSIIMNKQSG
ncbi:FGGY carbohydrate kinase domain-containing protein-like isoform X1 [Stegodyphus dumicola]|uniref:FGGY carbohydrate kinase domain-containing protein-like isoform X1 n=2 Tax=Stegodyphus dumicola TaxID=202533 RepID=UPI0015A7EF15|nr:FGGY carbohydrate kinase domain-containing protein-like isoform X1 [Stegodyphus dumicola]